MARLICRWPSGAVPTAEQARAAGISAWLVPAHTTGTAGERGGPLVVEAERAWLVGCGLPFALEWRLGADASPEQLDRAVEQLQGWLRDPLYLRWRQQAPLWIADPEHIPPDVETSQGWRQLLGPEVVLWGGGPLRPALDGSYQRPLQDLPCQRLNGHQLNYQSFLYHAHHATAAADVHIPAVLACDRSQERRFAHASAALYNEWVALACSWSDLWHGPAEQGWVLVESWQGHRLWWTPCSPVEPAPAPAASEAPAAPPLAPVCISWGTMDGRHPALLVHLYHLELLEPMLQQLGDGERPALDLYVSTPAGQAQATAERLQALGWQRVWIVEVPNRGRDLAPFLLELLPRALAQGHPWLVKLHTKRSSHLKDGEPWAQHLWRALASSEALLEIDEQFRLKPRLGLLAPPGTLLPTGISLHHNDRHLLSLLRRAGLAPQKWLQQPFVAGSMFAARSETLRPLLALQLGLDQFEPEQGHLDGDLAHALERLIAPLALEMGHRVQVLAGSGEAVPRFGYGWAAPTPLERLQLAPAAAVPRGAAPPPGLDWCVLVGQATPESLDLALSSDVPLLVVCADSRSNRWLQALQAQLPPYRLGVCEAVLGAQVGEQRWYRYNDPRRNGTLGPAALQPLHPNLQVQSSEPIRQLPLAAILEQWPWAEGDRGWLLLENQPGGPEQLGELLRGAGPWLHQCQAVWLPPEACPAPAGGTAAEPRSWRPLLREAALLEQDQGRWQRDEGAWLKQQRIAWRLEQQQRREQQDRLEAQVRTCRHQLEQTLQHLQQRDSEHAALAQQQQLLQANLASLQQERDSLLQVCSSLEQQAGTLQHQLQALQGNQAALIQQQQQLESSCGILEAERDVLMASQSQLFQERDRLQTALAALFPYSRYGQLHPEQNETSNQELIEHYLKNPNRDAINSQLSDSARRDEIARLEQELSSAYSKNELLQASHALLCRERDQLSRKLNAATPQVHSTAAPEPPAGLLDCHLHGGKKTTDKWESYFPIYDRVLNQYRHQQGQVKLLEIGVLNGGSLETWQQFLGAQSLVSGVDHAPEIALLDLPAGIDCHVGDATDPEWMTALGRNKGPFDIIIDDGSHRCKDIITTFLLLFPHLSSAGTYVIEDTHTTYREEWGGSLPGQGRSAMDFFKSMADLVNLQHWQEHCDQALDNWIRQALPSTPPDHSWPTVPTEEWLQLESVEFHNSLVILRKTTHGGPCSLGQRIVRPGESPIYQGLEQFDGTREW